MYDVGVVRKTDSVGRLVLPVELRKLMGIETGDSLELFLDGATLILRKYDPVCFFCNEANGVTAYRGKRICPACLTELLETVN